VKILIIFILYAVALSIAMARGGFRSRTVSSHGVSLQHPKRVLIVGATGGTGRQLVTQALERGYEVTAFVRDPQKLSIDNSQLTLVQGDVLDYESVDRAMRGQEAVLSALGHKRFFIPTRILSEGTRNILRTMESHHVSRFVCETSLGIGDTVGRLGLYYTLFVIPVILPFYFWDKTRQEQIIAASNTEWVIVRPAALTNGDKRGTCRHGSRIGNFFWTARISRADVADFMLSQLISDAYLRAAPGASR
jgi:nucleoside-diphosphate-sugar epimerase